ncbi:pantoate--beta-alanine ligase [Mesorhizobium sp. M0904]|uniref:pantoate--beta-alanine ligase n=1 Tax=Mesorhizobium sp. M0904 TaxID=2957022 RepID=UPI003336A29C
MTLFVNPKQFNSQADLAAYQRTEREDAAKLAPLSARLLYAPDGLEMYPDGFAPLLRWTASAKSAVARGAAHGA